MAKWTFTSNVLNMPRMNDLRIVIACARRKEVGGELVTVPEKAIQFRKGIFSTDKQEEFDFLTKSDFGKKNYKITYMLLEDAARIKAPAPGPPVPVSVGPPVKPVPLQQQAPPPTPHDPLNRDEIRRPEPVPVRSAEDAATLAKTQGSTAEPVAPAAVALDFQRGGQVPVKKGKPERESEISEGEEEEVSGASPMAKAMAGGVAAPEAPTQEPASPAEVPAAPSPPAPETRDIALLTWPELKVKAKSLGIKTSGITKADLREQVKAKLSA